MKILLPSVNVTSRPFARFSAWFFVTLVALTFLDAYLLGGKGIGFYFSVPGQILANAGTVVGA